MERRTRQRQGARWQTKEKRERRGAQRAQGEEGGKGPAASGGAPRPGRERQIPRKQKGETAHWSAPWPGNLHFQGHLRSRETGNSRGERPRSFPPPPPSSTRAGWGWDGFFGNQSLAISSAAAGRSKSRSALFPPPQAGQPSAAEPKQLGKGFLGWNKDCFGGPRPRG